MQHKNPQLVPWYTVHYRHVRHCLRAASGKWRRSGGATAGGRARHLCRCHYALAVTLQPSTYQAGATLLDLSRGAAVTT